MKEHFLTFRKYQYFLKNLIIKDIKLKYRRSILGLAWSVLNPLLMMIVITTVFSNIFKIKVENFAIYFLTGSTLFSFFAETTSTSMTSVLSAGSLIKKVYIPKYIFPLEKCLFGLVNFLFSLIAVAIIFLIKNYPIKWTILLFPIPVMYTLVFSIGLSLILASLCVFFKDILHLYTVILTAWNYLTPIMYPYEILSDNMRRFMKFNPMYYFVDYFRNVMMNGKIPDLSTNIICLSISLCTFVVGVIIFKINQDKFILYI